MLTSVERYKARHMLAEHKCKLWTGEDGVNDTSVSMLRYWPDLVETELDNLLEYLRRWCSAKNQNVMTVSGATDPDVNGSYYDAGISLLGFPVMQRDDGRYEFRRVDSDGERFQLVRSSEDKVLWESDVDAASYAAALWSPVEDAEEWGVGMDIGVGWDISSEGVIEPVSGALAVDYTVPVDGINYRSVTDPMVNKGKVREGVWRAGELRHEKDFDGRYGCKGAWVIIQELSLELNVSASIAQGDTRWRIQQGGNKRGSNQSEVLELPYCDPTYAKALAEANTNDTYTNTIYTVNGGLLSGTWHNLETKYVIDPKTGFATVRWFVSRQANDDVHFAYTGAGGNSVVDFFKFDAADTGMASFETDYFFDNAGNWYIGTDEGARYSSMNGEEVELEEEGDEYPLMPDDVPSLGNMRSVVPGRVATVQITRSESTRFYRLHAHIEFIADQSYSLAFYSDAHVLVSEVVEFSETADLSDFADECQVDTETGAVVISATEQGGNYASLSKAVDGRSVKLDAPWDAKQGKYRLTARVIQYHSYEVFSTYLKSSTTRVIDFYLFGASRTELNAALLNYYFNDSGDWFYSTDGANYTRKNGIDEAGTLQSAPIESIVVDGNTFLETADKTFTEDTESMPRIVYWDVDHWKQYSPSTDETWTYTDNTDEYPPKTGWPVGDQGSTGPVIDYASVAFSISTDDTTAIRMVSPPQIERNPAAEVYVLHLHLEYASAVTTGNTAAYGTPLVKVTDILVVGKTTLPDVSGSAGYNDEGTKETETRILDPRYDVESETYSYIERTIEKWAPHADQNPLLSDDVTTNPDYALPGYVEGPSEIRVVSEPLPLAKGIGSGFGGAGSWAGGGVARVRYVTGSDGVGQVVANTEWDSTNTQISKRFQPYNITLARCKIERASARLYYYVKEPTHLAGANQYPAWADEPVEDMDTTDVGSSGIPSLVSTVVTDDTAQTFGTKYSGTDGYHEDASDYCGKLVLHTYSDGKFTLAYYEAHLEPGANASDEGSNITWRTLKFIRTYPATGDGTATGYGDGTVRVDETGLQTDPSAALTNDDGDYMGHYIISSSSFYTASIRHRIIKVSESVYALLVEKLEITPWRMDDDNKWILNAEGADVRFSAPPSFPSLADSTDASNVPFKL